MLDLAKKILEIEIDGIKSLISHLDVQFEKTLHLILNCSGRVILCGMGKSGLIAKKISATLTSTGTPSFFMHPGEAFHGDLGMVKPEDVFIGVSYSGETEELLRLLPFLIENKNSIIGISGNKLSTLAQFSTFHLSVKVPKEACSLQLAPTASTTTTLALGDAIAICLMEMRNFKPENFAKFHPGGALGRRLLCKVKNEVISEQLPFVDLNSNVSDVINSISAGRLGLTLVKYNSTIGIITDGDLRRAIEKYGKNVFDLQAINIASFNPKIIDLNINILKAYEYMDVNKISSLLVYDGESFIGVLKR